MPTLQKTDCSSFLSASSFDINDFHPLHPSATAPTLATGDELTTDSTQWNPPPSEGLLDPGTAHRQRAENNADNKSRDCESQVSDRSPMTNNRRRAKPTTHAPVDRLPRRRHCWPSSCHLSPRACLISLASLEDGVRPCLSACNERHLSQKHPGPAMTRLGMDGVCARSPIGVLGSLRLNQTCHPTTPVACIHSPTEGSELELDTQALQSRSDHRCKEGQHPWPSALSSSLVHT